MTRQEIQDMLEASTDNLSKAHQALYEATLAVTATKRTLTEAEAHHTLAGLEGKNADARKAELATLTETEQRDCQLAEDRLAERRLILTLAELDHQLARNLLRLHTSYQEENS